MATNRFLFGALLILAASGHAQTTIQLPPGPVTPGVPFAVALTNNTAVCIDVMATNVLTLLQPDGELIAPELVGCGPVAFCLNNGQSTTITYTAPATGPGSSGSYVLLCPYGSGAAERLDVGPASTSFPDIHTYPVAMPHGPGAHHLQPTTGPNPDWEFSNTANVTHVLSPVLRIFTPGGVVPVAFSNLPSVTVPAKGVARVFLPLSSLPSGPYTVEVEWFDPGIGAMKWVRHGIEISAGTSLDLHFPGGRDLLPGGTIPARVVVDQYTFFAPSPWPYALLVGFQPGSTLLPGGALVPLVPDYLVIESLLNGIGGLLTANVGSTTAQGVYCAHGVDTYPVATGLAITHPGPPSLGGLVLRVAAIAQDPATGNFLASQPEEISCQ